VHTSGSGLWFRDYQIFADSSDGMLSVQTASVSMSVEIGAQVCWP
jgi:hypothetical protein